jgi:hypothetical protein
LWTNLLVFSLLLPPPKKKKEKTKTNQPTKVKSAEGNSKIK